MNDLKQWFFDLSPRDQLMLVVGSGLLLIYILVFLVYLPMKNGLEQTERRNIAAMEEQQRVRDLAGQVLATRAAGGDPADGGGNLNSALNSSLREHGLTMENFQPSGSGARVRLGASEFTRVLAWLHDLEVKRGLHIRDLTITADQTPGAVVVNLQLQQGE